jgi:Mn-dependent DtxR family transcriptional regulator
MTNWRVQMKIILPDLESYLGVSRLTAANYLNKLADDKMLRKEKLGSANYYINEELFELLTRR